MQSLGKLAGIALTLGLTAGCASSSSPGAPQSTAYEARRSSESGWSRVFGGYRDDKAIQQEDIKDLAQDLADFVARTKAP